MPVPRSVHARSAALALLVAAGSIAGSPLAGCSALGLGGSDEAAAPAKAPATKSTKLATPKSARTEALQQQSTDMQGMLDALDKLNANPNASVRPPTPPAVQASQAETGVGQAAARGAQLSGGSASADQPVPQVPPVRTPTLVASTIAIADKQGPEATPAAPPKPQPPALTPPVTTSVQPAAQANVSASTDAPAPTTTALRSPEPSSSPRAALGGEEARLDISTLALCQRVESFGRYTPLPTSTFLAGRPAQMIVYTELAGFTQQPDSSDDSKQYVTELSQTIELYLDSDGSKQFVVPKQSVREVSRSPRRDFYLVQRVDLPRNLSVGKYNLKVRVTDLASGQESERSQRINIVADPSAKSENATRPVSGSAPKGVASGEASR